MLDLSNKICKYELIHIKYTFENELDYNCIFNNIYVELKTSFKLAYNDAFHCNYLYLHHNIWRIREEIENIFVDFI